MIAHDGKSAKPRKTVRVVDVATLADLVNGALELRADISPPEQFLPSLDDCGWAYRQLTDALEALRPVMVEAMRKARADGETWYRICVRSGYTSINGVRQMVEPRLREKELARERAWRKRASEAG